VELSESEAKLKTRIFVQSHVSFLHVFTFFIMFSLVQAHLFAKQQWCGHKLARSPQDALRRFRPRNEFFSFVSADSAVSEKTKPIRHNDWRTSWPASGWKS
jgi:hypothetical protein